MRKHRPDFVIALLTFALLAAGLIIIYAIGARVAQFENSQSGTNFSDNYFILHHGLFVLASIVMLVLGWLLPYKFWQKMSKTILIVSMVLCALIPLLGKLPGSPLVTCDLGACRSIRIPGLGFGFQAVEMLKLGILLYLSGLIKKRKEQNLLGKKEFWVPVGALLLFTVIFVGWLQKDLGSTMVIFCMVLTLVFLAGVEIKQLGILLLGIVVAAGVMIVVEPHRIARLESFNGEGDSYHIENSLIGMGTGGLFGVGLGNSIQSTGYLPEALSDSIFSIVGETWGFLGAMAVMVGYIVLARRILSVSQKTQDVEQSLFVAGFFAWLLAHVIINVGGMTGLTPMKGITLPFLSYGGTSMFFMALTMGIVLQISGWTRREVSNEDSSSRWGKRRTRYASSSRRSWNLEN